MFKNLKDRVAQSVALGQEELRILNKNLFAAPRPDGVNSSNISNAPAGEAHLERDMDKDVDEFFGVPEPHHEPQAEPAPEDSTSEVIEAPNALNATEALVNELAQTRRAFQLSQQHIAQLQDSDRVLRTELGSKELQLNAMQQLVAQMERELAEKSAEAEQWKKEAFATIPTQSAIERDAAIKTPEYKALGKDYKTALSEIDELKAVRQRDAEQHQAEVSALRGEFAALKHSSEQDIGMLKEAMSRLHAARTEDEATRRNLENELQQTLERANTIEAECSALHTLLESTSAARLAAEKAWLEEQERLRDIQQHAEIARNKLIGDHKIEIDLLQQKIHDMEHPEALTAYEKQISVLNNDRAVLRNQLATLESEHAQLILKYGELLEQLESARTRSVPPTPQPAPTPQPSVPEQSQRRKPPPPPSEAKKPLPEKPEKSEKPEKPAKLGKLAKYGVLVKKRFDMPEDLCTVISFYGCTHNRAAGTMYLLSQHLCFLLSKTGRLFSNEPELEFCFPYLAISAINKANPHSWHPASKQSIEFRLSNGRTITLGTFMRKRKDVIAQIKQIAQQQGHTITLLKDGKPFTPKSKRTNDDDFDKDFVKV
jgi:hypothetical protein